MFCPKCGAQVADDGSFCPKCGSQMPRQVRDDPFVLPTSGRTKDIGIAVAQIVLALVSLLPLFKLNMVFIGGNYTVMDVLSTYMQYSDQVASFTSYMKDEFSIAAICFVGAMALWIAAIIAAIVCLVSVLRGSDGNGSNDVSFALFAIFSILCFVAILYINDAFSTAVSGYGLVGTSLLGATSGLWILGIGSIVGFVVSRMKA